MGARKSVEVSETATMTHTPQYSVTPNT